MFQLNRANNRKFSLINKFKAQTILVRTRFTAFFSSQVDLSGWTIFFLNLESKDLESKYDQGTYTCKKCEDIGCMEV